MYSLAHYQSGRRGRVISLAKPLRSLATWHSVQCPQRSTQPYSSPCALTGFSMNFLPAWLAYSCRLRSFLLFLSSSPFPLVRRLWLSKFGFPSPAWCCCPFTLLTRAAPFCLLADNFSVLKIIKILPESQWGNAPS